MSIQRVGETVVVKTNKVLDINSSTEMEKEILTLIENGYKSIIVDLSILTHISSSGIRVFISALRKMKEIGGSFKLAEMRDNIKKVFITVELLELFDVYETTEDALSSSGENIK